MGVDLGDGLRALVQPATEGENGRALAVAHRLQSMERALGGLAADKAVLVEELRQARAQINTMEAINRAALTGQRRFFGPVLMRPVNKDWSGEVWLLDPEKQERGKGLRFANVAEVRALHPELWVIGVQGEDVLLDAWGQ